jgi:hypothetical protein
MSRRFQFSLRALLAWPDMATMTPTERATFYRFQCLFLFLGSLGGMVKGILIGRYFAAILLGGGMALLAVALFFFGKPVRNR